MLVSSDGINMDSERAASAHRAVGASGGLPPLNSACFSRDCFKIASVSGDSGNGAVGNIVPCLTWRNTHHLQFIRAFDATSRSNRAMYGRIMSTPDLNLLVTLDVLVAKGRVGRAAQKLRLSPSAMSRALAGLRETTGDPLLVRAGRGLVPTPRALELRARVGQVVQDAEAVLRPAETLDLKQLVRTFTLRNSEGFVETFGPDLIARIGVEAPGVRLRFVPKPAKDSTPLRDGSVDLETGVVGKTTGPEVRVQGLFRDRFIGVVRTGHPLSHNEITPARYAAGQHVLVSRRGLDRGPVDDAPERGGVERGIVTEVGGFSAAPGLAPASHFSPRVPRHDTGNPRAHTFSFPLPVSVAEIAISLLWHPRLDADPAHRWLRGCGRDICAAQRAGFSESGAPFP